MRRGLGGVGGWQGPRTEGTGPQWVRGAVSERWSPLGSAQLAGLCDWRSALSPADPSGIIGLSSAKNTTASETVSWHCSNPYGGVKPVSAPPKQEQAEKKVVLGLKCRQTQDSSGKYNTCNQGIRTVVSESATHDTTFNVHAFETMKLCRVQKQKSKDQRYNGSLEQASSSCQLVPPHANLERDPAEGAGTEGRGGARKVLEEVTGTDCVLLRRRSSCPFCASRLAFSFCRKGEN